MTEEYNYGFPSVNPAPKPTPPAKKRPAKRKKSQLARRRRLFLFAVLMAALAAIFLNPTVSNLIKDRVGLSPREKAAEAVEYAKTAPAKIIETINEYESFFYNNPAPADTAETAAGERIDEDLLNEINSRKEGDIYNKR